MENPKILSPPVLPVLKASQRVLKPPGRGLKYWIGAPSVLFDRGKDLFYLYYRIRKPRPIRGYACRIAQSRNGINFEDIWEATKEDMGSESIERACLVKTNEGQYRLYISCVDPDDRTWRIDSMEASRVEDFDISKREPALLSSQTDGVGVKDPVILRLGGLWYMIVSFAVPKPGEKKLHETGDAFATGKTKSVTGLATSPDGKSFTWRGVLLDVQKQGWDSLMARVSAVLYRPPVFHLYYDGTHTHNHEYPGRLGLAVSLDLKTIYRISPGGPIMQSPHSNHSLRYLDYAKKGKDLYMYYECATEDGSNELRMNIISDFFRKV